MPDLLTILRDRLLRTAAARLPLCAAHITAARAALPYPAQGVHLRVLQRPVDEVPPAACWGCQAAGGTDV